MKRIHTAIAVAFLAGPALPQEATSPSFQLLAESFDAGGGGICSPGFAAHFELSPFSAEQLASTSYTADLGFLGANDPEPTNLPVVFGLSLVHGPDEGGTGLTLTGLNFDKGGAGASLFATFDGSLASNVSVVSDTTLTLDTPPGALGPVDVEVTTFHGSDLLSDGWVYSPAIDSSPTAVIGGTMDVVNYGQVGDIFSTSFSFSTFFFPLGDWGDLLIGPLTTEVLSSQPYAAPDGVAVHTFPVPNDTNLIGATIYLQSASITFVPLEIQLTNRTQTTFQ